MTEPLDMSHPVTRAELREDLAKHPTKADLREELANHPTKAELREALAKYPTKDELRVALANHPTKAELAAQLDLVVGAIGDRLQRMETRWDQRFVDLELRLVAEMSRLFQAGIEHFERVVLTSQEPYRDLPARVTRLEAKVFPPRRARRR